MSQNIRPYHVTVQASPEEILFAQRPDDLCLSSLRSWPEVGEICVALPALDQAEEAAERILSWGFKAHVGDAYNVCRRFLAAQDLMPGQDFVVRVVGFWRHVDLDYVDSLVQARRAKGLDLAVCPRDFDVTMAADVAGLAALEKIGGLDGESAVLKRAVFNPWGYMEAQAGEFQVEFVEPAPAYSAERRRQVLSERRNHPEREFFGPGYTGSHYHALAEKLPAGLRILDIACGSGFGSELLAGQAAFVLGVDYDPASIEAVKKVYPPTDKLQFAVGDGQIFVHQGEPFDLVVSFHTLEHVPDDAQMLKALNKNLKPGGRLVLEVPLLARRPLGVPINPYHIREYSVAEALDKVKAADFFVEECHGASRGFVVPLEKARDGVQVWARKA